MVTKIDKTNNKTTSFLTNFDALTSLLPLSDGFLSQEKRERADIGSDMQIYVISSP